MSWREQAKFGLLSADRFFLGDGSGGIGTDVTDDILNGGSVVSQDGDILVRDRNERPIQSPLTLERSIYYGNSFISSRLKSYLSSSRIFYQIPFEETSWSDKNHWPSGGFYRDVIIQTVDISANSLIQADWYANGSYSDACLDSGVRLLGFELCVRETVSHNFDVAFDYGPLSVFTNVSKNQNTQKYSMLSSGGSLFPYNFKINITRNGGGAFTAGGKIDILCVVEYLLDLEIP